MIEVKLKWLIVVWQGAKYVRLLTISVKKNSNVNNKTPNIATEYF